MVSSAQLKIVLENSWTLESFEKEAAISRLRIRLQRSHLQPVISRLRDLATASQGSQRSEVS
jgi:hypothetical protein